MIAAGLQGVDFVVANTDAQALTLSKAQRKIQMGVQVTEGLGAGSQPEVGRAAAEEVIDEIRDHLSGAHMVFVTAGMGGGTGTGAAPVIARSPANSGILTVGVVTKPFQFEGERRMRFAEAGIAELQKDVDTLIIIPNQNLFRVANEKTTFADAFAMADQVLYSGVACITDLMVKEGLINLDFADVRAVMREMGKAMMGTGEASGEKRAHHRRRGRDRQSADRRVSMKGANGLLISITGGKDLTLYEVDEAATRIREEVDQDANIIVGATFDESLEGIIRVSVVATGIDKVAAAPKPAEAKRPAVAPMPRMAPAPTQAPASGASGGQLRARSMRRSTPRRTAAVAAAIGTNSISRWRWTTSRSGRSRRNPRCSSISRRLRRIHASPESFAPFIPPQAERIRSARACRKSTNCRRRRSARSWRIAVNCRRRNTRKSSVCRLLKRLATAGLGRKPEPEEAPVRHDPRMLGHLHATDAAAAAVTPGGESRSRVGIRRAARRKERLLVWMCMAGRLL